MGNTNMKRRRFTNEGLSVAEICNAHGIGQGQYYKWREQFMSNMSTVFKIGKPDTEKGRLMSENSKVK